MKLLSVLMFFLSFLFPLFCESTQMQETLGLGNLEPRMIDARKFYIFDNFTDEEADDYVQSQNSYFENINGMTKLNNELKDFLTGTWELIYNDKLNLYDFIDYGSFYSQIMFNNDSFYGYAVYFFGSGGTKKLYQNQDYLVSTVGTMGWIGPILRYEFVNDKMYLYILNMDKWELADFHEGGKNYFIKTSDTFNPLRP